MTVTVQGFFVGLWAVKITLAFMNRRKLHIMLRKTLHGYCHAIVDPNTGEKLVYIDEIKKWSI